MKKNLTLILTLLSLWMISLFNNQKVEAAGYDIFSLINEPRITKQNWLNNNDQEVVKYLYDNKMTIFSDFNKFRPYDNILRSEVTKFFVKFAESKWLASIKKQAYECNFNDVKEWKVATDLIQTIKTSCQYGLFNWNKWNFNPSWNITKGEAIAVTIRMIEWKKTEESWSHWALNYYKKAKDTYMIALPSLNWAEYNTSLLNQPITRVDMWRLLEWVEFYKNKVQKAVDNTLNSL